MDTDRADSHMIEIFDKSDSKEKIEIFEWCLRAWNLSNVDEKGRLTSSHI